MDIFNKYNILINGEGSQPMLFAHGFGCDQNMWRFIESNFRDEYKTILFDYVGWGKSDLNAYKDEQYSSLEGYVEDLLEICSVLDLQNLIFVGHSVSSIIGILASIREPNRFERLILVGPSPSYINDLPEYVGGFERSEIEELFHLMDKNFMGWASFMAPVVMKNPEKPELVSELQESFCSTDPRIARNFAMSTFFSDNRSDLQKVKVPSLIMQCTEDTIAPLYVGEYLHRKLKESELRIMKATGHCPHMSHPLETIEIMEAYLEKRKYSSASHG